MAQKNIIRGQAISKEKLALAKEFRLNMTDTEKILWQSLRSNKLGGWHFRRQQILFGYIVDFYCHAASLVIEADGEIHESQQSTDRERDTNLTDKGFKVLRFGNHEIEHNLKNVLAKILAVCNQTLPNHPNSLPFQGKPPSGMLREGRGRGPYEHYSPN